MRVVRAFTLSLSRIAAIIAIAALGLMQATVISGAPQTQAAVPAQATDWVYVDGYPALKR